MKKVVFLVYVVVIVGTYAQQPPCDCFPINTIDTSLEELVSYNPLYTQAASVMSLASNINTVCHTFARTCTLDSYLVEQAVTYNDDSTLLRASIQSTNESGHFSIVGPSRSYDDFVLGNPCPGTYTIYRCIKSGTCVTEPTLADVIVVSTRFRDQPECIEKGVDIAVAAFPGMEFYDVPRNASQPCFCQISIF